MRPPHKECRGCCFWRPLSGKDGVRCCHYCLDMQALRKQDGERCLSFKTKNPEQKGAYKPRAMQVRI